MKELEEVNCEIRRIVDLQLFVLNRLRNLQTEEHGQGVSQEYSNISDCNGGFLHNATYAWLSYGCHFVVFNVKTGESVSSWTFCGTVTSVSQFPTQSGDLPLLLVGIDNNASKSKDSSGLLCIFDCTISRVLRAIRMPCGIEQVCVVSGGLDWEEFNDKRPDNILNEMDGIACVILRNLQHIMVDLQRPTWDVHDLSTIMDETSPAEINLLSTKQVTARYRSNQERHIAYNLLNNRIEKHIGFNRKDFESSSLFGRSLTTTIISCTKIGCLISGCLGRVIIWQNDGTVGWISAPVDENMAVTHLALLEPTDDPRPFYYIWVVFQDESSKVPPVLRMYAMLFERKYCDHGMNLYFNLEANPSLKFEFELSEGDRVVSLCTVERESSPEQTDSGIKKGEDNLLLIATNERILLFDLNQWYKEQMPRTIDECQNPNSILATYRTTRSDHLSHQADNRIVSFAYIPLSLQEFPSNGPSSPEELFYPNSLSLEWAELSPTKLTFWMTRGIQADLLREMAIAGPIILIQPSETFHRCLSVGLVPFNSEFSFVSDQNAQREMLLSLCLEQRWSTFLVKCAVEWSDGSASYLYPTFLKWGVQRASAIKMFADRLCVPLFDQSGSGIGEADVKTLRFCSQQLECLSSVVAKLPSTTADLTKQRRTLKRVSTYFQVLLWFYDVGLLPETQDLEEGALPISLALKVPYPYEKLSALYKEKRAQARANKKTGNNQNEEEDDLFIDELITRECPILKEQWEREGGACATNGCYPPPSLQSLLRSYLTDCKQTEPSEISCKHQITIYLLMDLAMLLQRLYPSVDQLIKYPSAFKMSPSLIKLTQAFWLLDHEDYQGFLDMMTGQLVSDSDVKDWHHRLVLRTLVRNNQHKLALVYLRIRKPPLSSVEEQGVAVSLSVEHGLVQSAFHRRPPCHYEQLLTCFFHACKTYGKLDEILHLTLDSEEEEVFVKFLEENKTEDVRLLYYLQRCRYTEAISSGPYSSFVRYHSSFTQDIQSASTIGMLGAYNMTLPDITKQFSANTFAVNSDMDMEARYPRPMSHCKSHDKLRNIHETVIAKARETYLRGEKCQIPFVSAPCMSLKFNNHSANVNCVLFPSLVRKTGHCAKRTLDQIYEDKSDAAEGTKDSTPDGPKRRKLSNGSFSSSETNGAKASELNIATFDTPLVKRRFNNASTNKDAVTETPQSILKIRHLIRSSVSPGAVALPQTKEVVNKPPGSERGKNVTRQIRFNINQSRKTLMYEKEEKREKRRKEEEEEEQKEEEEEEEKEKEKEKDEEEEEKEEVERNISRLNASNESDDVFLSPEVSGESYMESAVLSGGSNNSSRSYYYPRPRPSLRRSALSKESLQESRANVTKICDNVSASSSAVTSLNSGEAVNNSSAPIIANISKRRSSLLTTSIYSSGVLSTDSNVEISGYENRLEQDSPQFRWKSFVERDNKNRLACISSTPLTKSIISKTRVNSKQMEADNDDNQEKDMESELSIVLEEAKEILNVPSESEIHLNIERSDYDLIGRNLIERQDDVEGNVQGDNQQSLNKYNNGGIARIETPILQNPYEEQPVFSESERAAGLILNISDESEEELLRLRDDEEDDDEHEEAFESLSTTLEEAQIELESEVPVPLSSEIQDFECTTEARGIDTKSNGLRESVQVTGHIDFTDDESTRSRGATPAAVPNEPHNKNEECCKPNVCSENILYDLSNITDDESDNNIRETEEGLKANNGKFLDLSGQYVTKQNIVETGQDDESGERRWKSDKRKRNFDELSSQSDIESRKKQSLENSSSLDNKESPIVSEDQFVQVTKSYRPSLIATDQLADTSSPQRIETERVTRSRKGSSVAKNATRTDSPSRNINTERTPMSPSRSRKISLIMKDLPVVALSRVDEPPRLQKISAISPNVSSEKDVEKPPRLTRANSTKDVYSTSKDASPLTKPRLRRARSLAKELLTNSLMINEDLRSVTSSDSASSADALVSSVRRGGRSMSVAKEIPQTETKDSDTNSLKDEPSTVRRSARLISSAKKESQLDLTPTTLVKSESASSLSKLTSEDEGDKGTRKRSLRVRRSSVLSDTDKTMLSKWTDKEERSKETRTNRSRRGSSVPKEITMQTGRKRRSGSLMKETILEVAEPPCSLEGPRKLRSFTVKNVEQVINSPVAGIRSRSTSIQSIPEELEGILSQTSRETRSAARKEAEHSNTRERRASSADVLHKEMKKRIRSIRTNRIMTDPITEEPSAENEGRMELRGEEEKKMDNETTRDIPVGSRRKKVISITMHENTKKDVVKRKSGRPRRTIANEESSSNLFSFSQPEKADDMPLNEKDIGEVPNYVFSPPQTRSKNIFPNQHRRKMSSFIPSPYQERKQHPSTQILHDIVNPDRYARITVNTYGSRFRKKFVVPNKSQVQQNEEETSRKSSQ